MNLGGVCFDGPVRRVMEGYGLGDNDAASFEPWRVSSAYNWLANSAYPNLLSGLSDPVRTPLRSLHFTNFGVQSLLRS